MTLISAAFSTALDADRILPVESDYYCQFIPTEIVERERELYGTKWFDYRCMTPLQATKAYIEAYGEIYRRIYAREYDRERAEYVKPLEWDHLAVGLRQGQPKAKAKFVGCWRGRQIADFLTMPYGEYIDMAFTFRMRRWKQMHMPQPCHLYHEYDVEKIVERWEELKVSRLYLAEHPAFMVENYRDLPMQNDYHEWLFAQTNKRANPVEFLAAFVSEGRIPLDKVRARLGEQGETLVGLLERYTSAPD